MPEGTAQERTEKATLRRRQEARRGGKVAQSREIPSVLILITVLGVFYFAGSWLFYNLSELFSGIYQNIGSQSLNDISDFSAFSLEIFDKLFSILMPIFLPIIIAGVIGNVSQVGFEIHSEPMRFTTTRLNPVPGIKKFLSIKSLVELGKSVAKLVFVGGIAYVVVKKEMESFSSLIQKTVEDIVLFIGMVVFKICFFVCLALIFLAILDYIYQRWQYEQDLKMTKQEVKDERKQTEGDPKIKARIRRIQLEMSQRRKME